MEGQKPNAAKGGTRKIREQKENVLQIQ